MGDGIAAYNAQHAQLTAGIYGNMNIQHLLSLAE